MIFLHHWGPNNTALADMGQLRLLLSILLRQTLKDYAIVVGHLGVPEECWSGLVWNVIFTVAYQSLIAIFLLWLVQAQWLLSRVNLASSTFVLVIVRIRWSLVVDFLKLNNFIIIDLSFPLLTLIDFEV